MTGTGATVERLWAAGALLGESPVWSADDARLYWLDIKGRALLVFEPARGRCWRHPLPVRTTALVADGPGRLLALTDAGLVALSPGAADGAPALDLDRPLAPAPFAPERGVRFNDAKRAPDGAVWAGTMDDAEARDLGRWVRWAPGADRFEPLADGYRVTNGPAFDARRGVAYVTDSARRRIDRAPGWTPGALAARRPFRTFDPEDGAPDGMTVDAAGRLWVAVWDGGCVAVLAPDDGRTLARIAVPARRPTSCAFADARTLYVTSAAVGLAQPQDDDGALFRVRVDLNTLLTPER
ncbi:hypothetical protein CCR85_02185 [Rhodothalassium salexigens]|uniref:SMP-30/gluconolactonase/LRE family protein n=1 Tax=Rhodothalassium salexigens TaxID=1086 RepID=UPI001913DC10|nr:SMP-30/gluconolactonase/LRE family protein [Rhodothalassium salexigens]MBK5910298.1 hypothetical protein [Rhodothalassium salexigens]MBK5921089.1 hypothetical protein [Rhodothalassium salexigens]